jgi:parallel beta-helix repeat protein
VTAPTRAASQPDPRRPVGVLVGDGALDTLEDNDITGNAYSGVEITTDSNPTLRANRINRNAYQAVWIHHGGRAVIEDNDLCACNYPCLISVLDAAVRSRAESWPGADRMECVYLRPGHGIRSDC